MEFLIHLSRNAFLSLANFCLTSSQPTPDQRLRETSFSRFTILWPNNWPSPSVRRSEVYNFVPVDDMFPEGSLTLCLLPPCRSAGVGLATVVISFVFSTYYNVLMTWALYYFFNSFGANLPWTSCNNAWNVVENCSTGFQNSTHLQSASQQFFEWE